MKGTVIVKSLAFVAAALLFLTTQSAGSLDPTKAITQYAHEVWKTEQGLPQNTVSAMIQTRAGYIWVGTESAWCASMASASPFLMKATRRS